MKKIFLILSVLMIVGLALAACQSATGTPATEAPADTGAPASDVSGSIRVGSWDAAEGLKPWEEAIASFKEAYPNVEVNLESVPQGYGDKLLAEFASGTAPDVFQVGDGDAANWASQGQFEELDPYISGEKGNNPLDTSVFYQAVAEIGKVNGKTYLLTKDFSPLVLYYNKNLFDAAGVEYPTADWTWDDMLAAAQKLTVTDSSGTVTQWGIQIPDGWGDTYWSRGIWPIIYQNGGDVVSEDGMTTTGHINSDATVEAIQWYTDLFLKHKVAPTKADVDALAGQDLFATGKAAMLWSGVWPLGDYIKNTDISVGTAQLPKNKERGNSICWAGFAMYSKSQNKDAAWAFLRWIGADKGAESFAQYALTDVKPVAEAQGKTSDPHYGPVMADLENVRPLPESSNPKFSECFTKTFTTAMEGYFTNGGDLKAILTDVATQTDACLAK